VVVGLPDVAATGMELASHAEVPMMPISNIGMMSQAIPRCREEFWARGRGRRTCRSAEQFMQ
jgi:hypothetical protein